VTRFHFSLESPIDGSTFRSRNSLSLIPLPLGIPPIATIEPSTSHLPELHEHNISQMIISNYNYQSTAESQKLLQDIAIGDEVLIRVHPERFSLKTLKKLHTRRRGPCKVLMRFDSSTYELDIPYDLGISLVFSFEDLTHYRTFTRLQQFLVHPLQPPLLWRPATEEFV